MGTELKWNKVKMSWNLIKWSWNEKKLKMKWSWDRLWWKRGNTKVLTKKLYFAFLEKLTWNKSKLNQNEVEINKLKIEINGPVNVDVKVKFRME